MASEFRGFLASVGGEELVVDLHVAHDQRDSTVHGLLNRRERVVAVLRVGPYMCGEWEFGGLPAWLLLMLGLGAACAGFP